MSLIFLKSFIRIIAQIETMVSDKVEKLEHIKYSVIRTTKTVKLFKVYIESRLNFWFRFRMVKPPMGLE